MIDLFILLQAETSEITLISEITKEIIGIGITGIAAIVFAWLFLKERKKGNETREREVTRLVDEKKHMEERLRNDKLNADTQQNMLWTELKESKNEEIAKHTILTQSLNETQLQTVKALQETTMVVQENTKVMSKTMDVMESTMKVLNKFIDLLVNLKK